MRYTIEYGQCSLHLDVPARRVVGVLAPHAVQAIENVEGAVEAVLRKPCGAPPLAALLAGKRTALIVTVDYTRPSPAPLLRPILAACERAGVVPTIMIAPGRHRLMTDAEVVRHLGPRIVQRYAVRQHDAFDERSMVLKGRTRRGTPIRVNQAIFAHDIVIGTGIIEPSYLAGWSGGRKLLMPGLAHHASIDNNHFYLTHPDTRIGRLHGNPVSDDAAEFAARLPMHFIVYTINGPNDEVVGVVGGHAVKAHEQGCARCARIYRVRRMEADIVISSAGGHPYDCDLVQGKKAIIPAIEAVKRNGVVILCAECRGGLGAEKTFIDWLTHKTPAEVVRDVLDRRQFNLGAHGANILAKPIVNRNAKIVLVTCPAVAAALKGTYVTAVTRLSDAWKLANLIAGPDSSVLLIAKARRLIVS